MSCRVRQSSGAHQSSKRRLSRARNSRSKRTPPRTRNWSDRLYQWRLRNDLSQTEAAMKLQISPRTLQEWEQGRARPRHLALIALNKIIEG
jgi:DNA-binding transcriptional regulator YiaG